MTESASASGTVDWNQYAEHRLLGRNRLLFEHHQEVLTDFLQFFSRQSVNDRIVDVGCAAGFFLVMLRELGFLDLEGIDASEDFAASARAKGLACRVADVLADSFASSEFRKADVVLLMDVLEHLADPVHALRTIRRALLKEGGLVYVTVPIYDSATDKLSRVVRRKSRMQQAVQHDPTHVHAFTAWDIRRVVEESGFEVVSSKRLFCGLPGVPGKRLRDLLRILMPEACKGRFLRIVARGVREEDGS